MTAVGNDAQMPLSARELAASVRANWRAGTAPDAAAALRDNPLLAANRSVVIELAYEEYLQRERNGHAPDPSEFARCFPNFQASVQDLLEAHCLLIAQPELLKPPMDEWPSAGETVLDLEIRSELGRGTFGRAYLAFDPAIGRLLVLKLTPGGSTEARLIGGLNHPNVTDVLWTRAAGQRTAVCMPYVGSLTLAALIERTKGHTPPALAILEAAGEHGETPPDTRSTPTVFPSDSDLTAACAVAARIAHAIDYLHRTNVIHGDVKPSNVVLEPGGSPQVIDFNLAAGEEPARMICGTPAYMAPEVLDVTLEGRSSKSIDRAKADVFALGVTILELISGKHPYRDRSNGSLASLGERMRRCRPEVPAGIPASLARVLRDCLAIDPRGRPASACELASELDRFVRRQRSQPARRRNFAKAVAASCAALAIFAGLAYAIAGTIERAPQTADEYRARGLKSLHKGNSAAARADFVSAHERSADSHDLALAAYCYALSGEHDTAIEWSRRALDGGADTPEVRNNLAASLVRTSHFAEAEKQLQSLLERNPDHQAARYNRALLRFQTALKSKETDIPNEYGAVQDISAALAAEPVSIDLHLDAARIFALASTTDPSLTDQALDQLEAAVKAGQNPAKIVKDPILKKHLCKQTRFAKLTDAAPGAPASFVDLRLVEPIR